MIFLLLLLLLLLLPPPPPPFLFLLLLNSSFTPSHPPPLPVLLFLLLLHLFLLLLLHPSSSSSSSVCFPLPPPPLLVPENSWRRMTWTFTCYCGNTGMERIRKQESAQTVDSGEDDSPPVAPARTRTRDLSDYESAAVLLCSPRVLDLGEVDRSDFHSTTAKQV